MIAKKRNRRQTIGFVFLVIISLLLMVGTYFSYQDFKIEQQIFKEGRKAKAIVVEKFRGAGTLKNPHRVLFCHHDQIVNLPVAPYLFRRLTKNQEIELYYSSELKRYLPPDYNPKFELKTFLFIWVGIPLFVFFVTVHAGIKLFKNL